MFCLDLLYRLAPSSPQSSVQISSLSQGAIAQYFDHQSSGKIEPLYVDPFTQQVKKFSSHANLDKYMVYLLNMYAQEKNLQLVQVDNSADESRADASLQGVLQVFSKDPTFIEDFVLLKSFDYVFWLRYQRVKNLQAKLSQQLEIVNSFKLDKQPSDILIMQRLADLESDIMNGRCHVENHCTKCLFGDPDQQKDPNFSNGKSSGNNSGIAMLINNENAMYTKQQNSANAAFSMAQFI